MSSSWLTSILYCFRSSFRDCLIALAVSFSLAYRATSTEMAAIVTDPQGNIVSGEHGGMVRADRDKLLQALLNVLSNAVRYAEKRIDVEVHTSRGRITLTVADDGPGIAQELLPSLFHRFVKGKNGESGLGLAIARAIVERCGGELSVRNRPEGGAVFTFEFPPSAGSV